MAESKKVYLIDLDGTLLKANIFFFYANVFYILKNFVPALGFKTFKVLIPALKKLLKNQDPRLTNFEALTSCLKNLDKPLWGFYQKDFPKLSIFCSPVVGSADALVRLKQQGHRIFLTTNPIWPEECVRLRLKWAGVDPSLFEGITHSQNWHSCKPFLQYYKEVLSTWKLNASDCVLIGDSESKEGPASQIGIKVVILNPNTSQKHWDSLGR